MFELGAQVEPSFTSNQTQSPGCQSGPGAPCSWQSPGYQPGSGLVPDSSLVQRPVLAEGAIRPGLDKHRAPLPSTARNYQAPLNSRGAITRHP